MNQEPSSSRVPQAYPVPQPYRKQEVFSGSESGEGQHHPGVPAAPPPGAMAGIPQVAIPTIFFRTMAGFGAGLCGALVLGLILFLTWSVVGSSLTAESLQQLGSVNKVTEWNKPHPLFIWFILLGMFCSTLTASLVYNLLLGALEELYAAVRVTSIVHTFVGNIALLILLLPVYVTAGSSFGSSGISIAGILHILLGGLLSSCVLEILSKPSRVLTGLYGLLVSYALVGFFFFFFIEGNLTIIILVMMPLMYGALAFGGGLVEGVYGWFSAMYGFDFLDIAHRYGGDYGQEDISSSDDIHHFDELEELRKL